MPVHLQNVAIIASNPTPPPILISFSNDADRTGMGDAKESRRAQTDAHADDTACVVKAKPYPHIQ